MLVQQVENDEILTFKSNKLDVLDQQFKDDKAHARMIVQSKKIIKQNGDLEMLLITAEELGLYVK